jgi:hypothetical protein
MFPVYGGKCLSRKAVHSCHLGGKYFPDDEEVETWILKVAETIVKRLVCCEFRRTGKAMGQVYQWW